MTVSQADKDAVKRYQAGRDQITIRPEKGTKDRWRAAAARLGLSMSQMIVRAVEHFIMDK